jgi:hypothetical protein
MKVSNKDIKIIYLVDSIFITIVAIIWGFNEVIFSENMYFEAKLFQMITIAVCSGLGAIFLIYLGIIYKLSTSSGKIWLLLGIGILGWCLGDITYSYYETFTDISPFPSIADLFYLLGYIPLSLGLILQTRSLKMNLQVPEKIIIAIIFTIVSLVVLLSVVIIPIIEVYPIPQEGAFEYFIAALYPIFDLLLIICVMVVYAKFRKGTINTAWIFLLSGIVFTLIADIFFNWVETVIGQSARFEFYDLLFIIGYVFIYTGALSIINIMSTAFEKDKTLA